MRGVGSAAVFWGVGGLSFAGVDEGFLVVFIYATELKGLLLLLGFRDVGVGVSAASLLDDVEAFRGAEDAS